MDIEQSTEPATPPRARAARASRPRARLAVRIVPEETLDAATRDAMWRLFEGYYEDVERPRFDHDLAQKHQVILLRDRADGSLQGFSTLEVFEESIGERRFVAVYSGDTVVAEGYWGQSALQVAFVGFVMRCKLRHPTLPVYWYLISKGYKTYLLLARNFPGYWPRHDLVTPAFEAAILDRLGRRKFGDAWLPGRGILHFDRSLGRLRAGVAPIDAALLSDPDVRFFGEANPGHADGDELCCLGRVDLGMGLHFAMRVARRAVGKRSLLGRWLG
jgi:hypothetical protein